MSPSRPAADDAMRHFYAVRRGRVPGVYDSRAGCEAQTEAFRSSESGRFTTRAAAQAWLQVAAPAWDECLRRQHAATVR